MSFHLPPRFRAQYSTGLKLASDRLGSGSETAGGHGETEQLISCAVRHFLAYASREIEPVEPLGRLTGVLERIVDREQEPIVAKHRASELELIVEEVTTGRVPDVLGQVLTDRLGKAGQLIELSVEPVQVKGEALADVADNDFQPGRPVEHAADDQPGYVHGRFEVPAESGAGEHLANPRAKRAGVVDVGNAFRRRRWMEIDRHIEARGRLENWRKLGLVEKAISYCAVDHRSDESKVGYRPFKLGRGSLG